jgi:hypothetical protein
MYSPVLACMMLLLLLLLLLGSGIGICGASSWRGGGTRDSQASAVLVLLVVQVY